MILVGDFNANSASLTIQVAGCEIVRGCGGVPGIIVFSAISGAISPPLMSVPCIPYHGMYTMGVEGQKFFRDKKSVVEVT